MTNKKPTLKQQLEKNEEMHVRQPRSGSQRHNDNARSTQKLLGAETLNNGERAIISPRRHSFSRMLSPRNEIKIQDLKNQTTLHQPATQKPKDP